ncbi:PDZ domain-containing protein [Clostridium sp.]|uniref:PDZ domain-containing protein n=1 Tax=Clostridium sp. TaxID=1506 RepID=UPI003F3E9DCF
MELVLYTLRTVAFAIVEPSHTLTLIILGAIFYSRNRRISMMQKMTIGESLNSPLELTLSQLVLGILGGALASVILSVLGIVFEKNSGIELLFVVSLMLLFFKKRFVGFAYSGAVLGLVSIIFTFVATKTNTQSYININIPALIIFIGVIYIVEAVLVMIDGSRGALPVFSNKDNKIIGGFAFDRYWPVPVAVLIVLNGMGTGGAVGNVAIPEWWPLINKASTVALLATAVVSSLPMYGIFNYNSVTFTMEKKKKPIYSGGLILAYGISLILISQIANLGLVFQIITIALLPIGREIVLKLDKKLENKGSYFYVSDDDGVAVLEVSPMSPSYEVGIRSGDKILEVNNTRVVSEVEIFKTVKDSVYDIHFKIMRKSGEILDYTVKPRQKRVGILLVPKMVKREDVFGIGNDDFKKVLEELKRKR